MNFSIAMVDHATPLLQGLKSTRKFLSSLGRFGNTPFLFSMYGSGELPQAFCRLCAVFGGTYYLGKSVDGIVLKGCDVQAIITNGQRITCKNFVIGAGACPELSIPNPSIQINEAVINRKICLLSDSILPSEKEQLTFASIFPKKPSTLDNKESLDDTIQEISNKQLNDNIYVQEAGFGPAVCPKGMYVLQMTSQQKHTVSSPSDIDVDSVLSDKESLLWTLDFKIVSKNIVINNETVYDSNIFYCNGPYFELDYDLTIEHAKQICKQIYPDEDFLPRAPDPEEIIIGGSPPANDDTSEESTQANPSENLDNTSSEPLAPDNQE